MQDTLQADNDTLAESTYLPLGKRLPSVSACASHVKRWDCRKRSSR